MSIIDDYKTMVKDSLAEKNKIKREIEEQTVELSRQLKINTDKHRSLLIEQKRAVRGYITDYDNGMNMYDRFDLWLNQSETNKSDWIFPDGPARDLLSSALDCGYRHSTVYVDDDIQNYLCEMEVESAEDLEAHEDKDEITAILKHVIDENITEFILDW